MGGSRPRLAGQMLHRRQRHHLATKLGEALGTPQDPYVTFAVDVDDIPGVIPSLTISVRGRKQLPRLIDQQIAQHHIRSAHQQASALRHSRYGLQTMFHSGDQTTHAAGAIIHRGIRRQYRRGLGNAIAFKDTQTEFIRPQSPRFLLQLLGAGEDVPQAIEIVGMGKAGIGREKGIGPEDDRGIDVVGDLRNDAVV